MFVDRDSEARQLAESLAPGRPALVRLWGRRRLGKTSLIRERIPDLVYLYVDESATPLQLPRLVRDIESQTGIQVPGSNWSEFFRGLQEIPQVVAFDEFQRLLDTDPAAVAALQDAWDNHLKPRNARVVLSGSSIGMMQRLVRGRNAALLGRFTAQLQLRPLAFEHARLLQPATLTGDFLEWYAVFGGTPFYQEQARGATLLEAIDNAFLTPTAPLLEEPENLLASELRRPAVYSGILQAIGSGKRRLGHIAAAMNRPSTALTPYIQVLADDLGILQKDDPVLGPRQSARYTFSDPFFRFYYAYIHPALSSIHEGLVEPVRHRIQQTLPTFLGPAWEHVVREAVRRRAGTTWANLDLRVDQVGAWWTRRGDHEIDIVATGENHVIVGSCKWTQEPMRPGDLEALERSAESLPAGDRPRSYLLASRAGFTPDLRKRAAGRPDIALLTCDDLLP